MKNFFYKIISLLIVIIIAQIIIFRYIIAPIPEISTLDKYLRDNYDIIYFGDSVIDFRDETDKNGASITEMLHQINPSWKIADFSHGANQPEVYEAAIDYISRSTLKPKAIIIHINPASFSPIWNMTPGLQFEKQRFFLQNHIPFLTYFYRPLAISGAINVNTIKEKEYLETPVFRGNMSVGKVRDFTDEKKFATTTPENIRDTFIARYMYPLTPGHKKLKALSRAIDLGKKTGIKIYVYITPINYKKGTAFVGLDFLDQTKKNTDMMCKVVTDMGLACLNLAFGMDGDAFNYNRGYATEHMKEKGRAFIAEQLNKTFLSK